MGLERTLNPLLVTRTCGFRENQGPVLLVCMHGKLLQSCPALNYGLCFVLWTVAHQAPLSMGLSSQEYWRGLPWPPPGDLPDPGIEPASLTSALAGGGSLPLAPFTL